MAVSWNSVVCPHWPVEGSIWSCAFISGHSSSFLMHHLRDAPYLWTWEVLLPISVTQAANAYQYSFFPHAISLWNTLSSPDRTNYADIHKNTNAILLYMPTWSWKWKSAVEYLCRENVDKDIVNGTNVVTWILIFVSWSQANSRETNRYHAVAASTPQTMSYIATSRSKTFWPLHISNFSKQLS